MIIYPIVRNSAKCGLCGDEIVSMRLHDFATCKCGEISVDGGRLYLRRNAKTDINNIIETSIEMEVDDERPEQIAAYAKAVNGAMEDIDRRGQA